MRAIAHPARLMARQNLARRVPPFRPPVLFSCAVPFRRHVVYYANGPSADSQERPYEIIAADTNAAAGPSSGGSSLGSGSGSGSGSNSRSQHPFAEVEAYDQDASTTPPPEGGVIDADSASDGVTNPSTSATSPDPSQSPSPGMGFITTPPPNPNSLPSPPTGPLHTPTSGPQHPFDTHAFVTYLESHDLDLESSQTVMEATRSMIVERSFVARETMLGREEMENQAYLFKAALNELRTELNVRARNDGTVLRTAAGEIRREVEGLEVKIKEDVLTMKHEIEMEMNNRKDDTRTEMKGYDMTIEEINNKFTISLGDLRTEIEQMKWDATRRAISSIILVIVAAITYNLYSNEAAKPPAIPAPTSSTFSSVGGGAPTQTMRDMAVGTDDEFVDDDNAPTIAISDERLEKLLKERGLGQAAFTGSNGSGSAGVGAGVEERGRSRRGSKGRRDKDEVFVDRI